MKNSRTNNTLSIFPLAMIITAGIFNLRILPIMAQYGLSAIFYYLLVALVFFIPSALVCAELAACFPETGGMYVWIRKAFGPKTALLGIWLEWSNTVISFPVSLAFISGAVAYLVNPTLAHNAIYMFVTMLVLLWGTTLLNFLGIRLSGWVTTFGLIIGTFLPCLLIIGLGGYWLFAHHAALHSLHFQPSKLLPNLNWSQMPFLVGLMLSYSGMQMAGFHAQELDNPTRNYPKATFIALVIILLFSILGSLSIDLVLPTNKINIITGLIEAIKVMLQYFHLKGLIPIAALFIAVGMFACFNMWVIGPCKGLYAMAKYDQLPAYLQRTNTQGVPTTLLILQAIIGTLFATAYLWMPSVADTYWLLLALSAMLTLLMNIFLFASVLRLRYTNPTLKRPYKIPGNRLSVWLIAGIGMSACALAFCIGFIPPHQITAKHIIPYEAVLAGSIFVFIIIPYIFSRFTRIFHKLPS